MAYFNPIALDQLRRVGGTPNRHSYKDKDGNIVQDSILDTAQGQEALETNAQTEFLANNGDPNKYLDYKPQAGPVLGYTPVDTRRLSDMRTFNARTASYNRPPNASSGDPIGLSRPGSRQPVTGGNTGNTAGYNQIRDLSQFKPINQRSRSSSTRAFSSFGSFR